MVSDRFRQLCVKMELNWTLILISVLCMFISYCDGHPQCLDSRPPFQAEAPLSFCSNFGYSDFGCCTVSEDRNLQIRYANIERRIPPSQAGLWTRCQNYAKTFLCQTCSPYAAHIFDSEVSMYGNNVVEPRTFPGLCGSYCTEFHQSCYDLVQYYLDEMDSKFEERLRIGNAKNSSAFCSAVSLTDVDYCYPELLTNPVLNGNISLEQITKEGCLCVEPINEAILRNPIFLKHAADGSNRMFVGEQIGLVHIFYPDGKMLPEPFLDIQLKIKTTNHKGDERGMLGMVFHPRFKENGKFYLYYSTFLADFETGLGDHKIRVEEMRVNSTNPNKADENYNRRVLEVVEPFWNHNGGELLFGDDGYLYIFVGDGGKAGDTLRAAQNLTTMLGKVLRVDVDVPFNYPNPYKIPADNPFVSVVDARPEIYAYGVRNIWRCGKDAGDPKTGVGKGRIVCGDVGQSAREELNLLEKGANYGWNLKEGIADYCPTCPRGLPDIKLTGPIHDYPHSIGKSITGGNFYRGCHSPNLNGFYIYGDFMSGRIFRLLYDEGTKQWNNKELTMCGADRCTMPLENDYTTSIISFGEDEDGEVYMLSTSWPSTAAFEGHIFRLVDPSRRGNPANCPSSRPGQAGSTTPVPTVPTKSTTTTTQRTTTQRTTMQRTTTQRTSAGVIPLFHGSRMTSYLDYFKRKSRTNERKKMKKNRQNQRKAQTWNRWQQVQQHLQQKQTQQEQLQQKQTHQERQLQQKQTQQEQLQQTHTQQEHIQHKQAQEQQKQDQTKHNQPQQHTPRHGQSLNSRERNTRERESLKQQQERRSQKQKINSHSQIEHPTFATHRNQQQQQQLHKPHPQNSRQQNQRHAFSRSKSREQEPKTFQKSQTNQKRPSQPQSAAKLTFHGIKIRRCTKYPRELCNTNRIMPRQ